MSSRCPQLDTHDRVDFARQPRGLLLLQSDMLCPMLRSHHTPRLDAIPGHRRPLVTLLLLPRASALLDQMDHGCHSQPWHLRVCA